MDHGFDRFFGTTCCPTTDWLYAFIEGDRVPVPPAGKIDKAPLSKHPYAIDCRPGVLAAGFPMEEVALVFLKKSREFLESHIRSAPGKPFSLYHAAQAVHLPSFPADQFKGKTQAGPHGDFIHELDYVVGELLATLDKLGVADNTLVIFTSDNGPETTSVIHMRADYGHDGARPWRGMKRDQWEGGRRVPFLVRWPGKVRPGTTSAQLTSLTRVMATVAAIIGADLPNDAAEDSFNMPPALLGQDSGPIRPYLLQQAFGGPRYLSIRRGNWKYLDHTGSGGNRYDNNPGLKPSILPDIAPGAPGQPGIRRERSFSVVSCSARVRHWLSTPRAAVRMVHMKLHGNPGHNMRSTRCKTTMGCWTWLLALPLAAFVSGSLPAADRPHVLLIHADQVRMDALGAYGNAQIKTPAIDQLAADGVRFKNSFCSFPVCTPSRYSLLSGLPVHEHRGWNNHCTLPPGTPTFASLLRQAGYATRAVGKMHFTPTYLDVGFSELELAEQDGPGRWDDDYHRYLRRLGLVDANDLEDQRAEYRKNARRSYWENVGALPSNLAEAHYSTTWIGDRAVETLEKWDGQSPALLMVGFIKPHHPFDPPEPWAHQYNPDTISLLPGWVLETPAQDLALNRGYFTNQFLTEASVRRATALYYASLSELDAQIGRMLRVLKAKGLYDSTLIIFTSDHGEYLGFHHLLLKGNHLYDPLAKVPLIVKYPRRLAAGSVRDELVSTIDVAPTILKAAGLSIPPAMRGLNLADPAAAREIVFCETRPHVMARTQTSKLILDTVRPARSLFFDLEKDPLEMTNQFHDPGRKEEIAHLTRAIETWRPARLPEVYLDEDAPQIKQPNVPHDRAHRDEIAEWYARQMQQWRATNGGR